MEQPPDHLSRSASNITKKKEGALGVPPGFGDFRRLNDANLFSTSLPVLPHEKLNFTDSEIGVRSIDDTFSKLNEFGEEENGKTPIDDFDIDGILSFLPDDEEFFAAIENDYDPIGLSSQVEELEECDFFGSGGGMELDSPIESLTISMARTNININGGYINNGPNGAIHYIIPNGVGTVAGEHPFGEHPSRTLFVRNINSNVEDDELLDLFKEYGDIRALHSTSKHRGFVMITYYDIRAARTAMRALQNKPLRRRKLDIHFSIPKDNPSEKDINQGTLVIFNLDPSVSNDDVRQIFGAYGEVKEIRETPHKRHHKFIEYYDARAAEAALRALNRTEIAGKRIKLEPSRPGGTRRNSLIQQLGQEMEPDEARSYRHQVGSPIINCPPGTWAHVGSPNDNSSLRGFSQSPNFKAASPIDSNHLPGLSSVLTPRMSNTIKMAPIGKGQTRINNVDQVFSNSLINGVPFGSSRSFPEHSYGMVSSVSSSPGTSFGPPTPGGSDIGMLTGNQFLWGNPNRYSEHTQSSAWPVSSMGPSFISNGHGHPIPYSSHHGPFTRSSQHHVGSAPSGIPFERHFGYVPDSPEASFISPVASGSMGSFGRNEGRLSMNMGGRGPMNSGLSVPGNFSDNCSPGFRMISSPPLGNMYLGSTPFPALNGFEGLNERVRSRWIDNNGLDSKKQFHLDLEKIVSGEDTRTTLMIKNIPNKYTSKMLLAAIDEKHMGSYDFLYLPIDFKNKCNVGYAFINMVTPSHIIPFYEAFNGKKWEKFNSEKVALLAYARIQGLDALIAHFQNSSLMNEDKRCRPIIFHSEGSETPDQEPFPPNSTIIRVRQQPGTSLNTSPISSTKSSPDESDGCGLNGTGSGNGCGLNGTGSGSRVNIVRGHSGCDC